MSPKNFENIQNKIIDYFFKSDSCDELVNSTIDNIFRKAVMQPIYCPYYVKFLK